MGPYSETPPGKHISTRKNKEKTFPGYNDVPRVQEKPK